VSNPEMKRMNFEVSPELAERAAQMPYGIKSHVLRIILERVLDSVEQKGTLVYGAVLDGNFRIEFKT